jgi:hypothetical protein
MALAYRQGKLVLLVAGRHSCPNCNYMQNTVCETNSPPVKQLLQDQYVPWFCQVDISSEYYSYANGLGTTFILPLICCIDPAAPDTYLDRTTNVQGIQEFYDRLLAQVNRQVTNAQISQWSVTNGTAGLSLTNLTFGKTNRIERSLDLQSWTSIAEVVSVTRGTNWSEPLDAAWSGAFYRVSVLR